MDWYKAADAFMIWEDRVELNASLQTSQNGLLLNILAPGSLTLFGYDIP
jgi:hypothetical protein